MGGTDEEVLGELVLVLLLDDLARRVDDGADVLDELAAVLAQL